MTVSDDEKGKAWKTQPKQFLKIRIIDEIFLQRTKETLLQHSKDPE